MSDDSSLSFAMGEYSASFPTDRQYVTNHMWAKRVDGDIFRFGLTSYAVRLLQDIYFLDWVVDKNTSVGNRQLIGSIESKKAESDLFAPVAGTIDGLSLIALEDPSIINADTYGEGWLVEMRVGDSSDLLDPDGYLIHLEKAWDVAQKTIKGQVNS